MRRLTLLVPGIRPGLYWQLMWRFISPGLMMAVICSSIYFMLTNVPTYSAWDMKKVRSKVLSRSLSCRKACQEENGVLYFQLCPGACNIQQSIKYATLTSGSFFKDSKKSHLSISARRNCCLHHPINLQSQILFNFFIKAYI